MMARMLSGRRVPAALQRVDRPQAIALATGLAVTAAVGWLGGPLVLAVAVAIQLAAGGLGAGALMGPSRPGLGIARYTTLALAGVGATLAGRLLPGGVSLLFVPLLAVMLWAVLWLELRATFETAERTALDLVLTAILFAASAGIGGLLGNEAWPPPLGLVLLIGLLLALRSAEARGEGGVQALARRCSTGWPPVRLRSLWWCCAFPGLSGRHSWHSPSMSGAGPLTRSAGARRRGRWRWSSGAWRSSASSLRC